MMEILNEYKAVNDILLLFSYFPGKGLYRKEISEATGLSNIAVDKSLMKMESMGVIEKNKRLIRLKIGKYTKNFIDMINEEKQALNSPSFKEYKIVKEILRNCLDVWTDYSYIVLFGSRAKLVHTDDSDYDIALVFKEETKKDLEVGGNLRKLEKKFNVKIEPHYFLLKDFLKKKKSRNRLTMDIIKDGVFLVGKRDELL